MILQQGIHRSWLEICMPAGDNENPTRADIHRRAIGRWENEGGTLAGWSHSNEPPTVAGEIGDAEAANIRVRLIALENIMVALLAGAPESRSDLIREMAEFISPRPGTTPHRLTIEAARNMVAIVERAGHYKRGPH